MIQENMESEMPIPPYAIGIRILLIDPDIASLEHTTSLLRESTYQVTSITLPDVALSLVQEKAHKFDLIIAATNIQGIDNLTYLKSLTSFSNTPIVVISYEADFQFVTTTLQQGICRFLEKPLKREEARGLWQFVIRKTHKRALDHEAKKSIINDFDGKGKEFVAQIPKMKKSDDRNGNTHSNNQMNICVQLNGHTNTKRVCAKSDDRAKWNTQLHEKFMNVLTADEQGQALGMEGRSSNRPQNHPSQMTFAGVCENMNKPPARFGSSDLMFNLRGRIDQIRRNYWTRGKAETDLQNRDEDQTNATRNGIVIQQTGESNADDYIFLDEILAELRCDYGDNDLKSLGFEAIDYGQC